MPCDGALLVTPCYRLPPLLGVWNGTMPSARKVQRAFAAFDLTPHIDTPASPRFASVYVSAASGWRSMLFISWRARHRQALRYHAAYGARARRSRRRLLLRSGDTSIDTKKQYGYASRHAGGYRTTSR